jgi:malonyl-CoA decarboxylase
MSASGRQPKDQTLNVSFLQELLSSVAEQGRSLLPKSLFGFDAGEDVEELSRALVSGRGEASGVAIARELLDRYARLDDAARLTFFRFLATQMQPDPGRVAAAAQAHLDDPTPASLAALQKALESPRTEFFRRLNLAPGATPEIVGMRRDLLRLLPAETDLTAVDDDLRRLFYVWFNRGFLVLRRIDWNTPAAILDKIIRYEAVHEIQGWDDLRRRLDPTDRRCFAFFHPSLVDEPLVFVEVALLREMPDAIGQVLEEPHAEGIDKPPTTAVFYSISNCQEGLNFVTLSPVPQFAAWLEKVAQKDNHPVAEEARALVKLIRRAGWPNGDDDSEFAAIETAMMALAAHYFLLAKGFDGRPVDPVSRFHLGNGARLERINFLADTSQKSMREAYGLMVNYRYEPKEIERNHEAYANEGIVAASRTVRGLLKLKGKARAIAADQETPALPPPLPETAKT